MTTAQDAMYSVLAALDNQDAPLERYPDRLIEALARAGFAVVPVDLPFDVLGTAARHGVAETGNPKHCWDYLLTKVRVGPAGAMDKVIPPHLSGEALERTDRRIARLHAAGVKSRCNCSGIGHNGVSPNCPVHADGVRAIQSASDEGAQACNGGGDAG